MSEAVLSQYEARLVSALLNAVEDQYENRWRALTMLHTLARSSESVRRRLREPLALLLIMECGTHFSQASSPRREWLVAADLVTLVLSGEEAENTREVESTLIDKFMSEYDKSKNPVAMIVQSRFSETVLGMKEKISGFPASVETNMINQALKECLAVDYTQHSVSGASLYSALGFAIFGGVWGRIRWALRLTSKGALNAHAWKWSSQKHIARPLALWFMLDMLGTRLLTFASSDKFEFNSAAMKDIEDIEAKANVSGMTLSSSLHQLSAYLSQIPGTSNVSLASFLSVVQNCSFTAFSLWMISTRRYAFLPLAAAGIYNHYDQVKKIPQVDYVINMGKMQAQDAKHYFTGKGPTL